MRRHLDRVRELIHKADVPNHLPPGPGGKRLHRSAVDRWISRGVRGVKLKATKVGRAVYVHPADLEAFLAAINGEAPAAAPAPLLVPAAAADRGVAAELAGSGCAPSPSSVDDPRPTTRTMPSPDTREGFMIRPSDYITVSQLAQLAGVDRASAPGRRNCLRETATSAGVRPEGWRRSISAGS